MPDIIKRYTYEGVHILYAQLEKIAEATEKAHKIEKYNLNNVVAAELVAAIVVASFKEDGASASVEIRTDGMVFGGIAENDGRVCGYCEPDCNNAPNGVTVEITRRLYLRGDYKSIVCSENIVDAVNEYFKSSLQVEAVFLMSEQFDTAVLVEQFPITCTKEEIWSGTAEKEAEYLLPSMNANRNKQTAFFKKYTLVGVTSLRYGCTCSAQSATEILNTVPKKELLQAADESGYIELRCKFCGKIRRRKIL